MSLKKKASFKANNRRHLMLYGNKKYIFIGDETKYFERGDFTELIVDTCKMYSSKELCHASTICSKMYIHCYSEYNSKTCLINNRF